MSARFLAPRTRIVAAAAAVVALAASGIVMAQRNAGPNTPNAPYAATPPTGAPPSPQRAPATPAVSAPSSDPQVERGRYLARVADCVSCHTAPGGVPFAGGLSMQTPFGTVVSTNITPDPDAGIGNYTEADFANALRKGVAKGGHRLYPAMPYTSFARTSDEDLRDMYAYFRKDVPPSANKPAPTKLPFPFSMRGLMVFWNWLYLDDAPYRPDAARSAEWNRGAYLVNGLGHCGECHTPRSLIGGLKSASERDGDSFLSGAIVDGWYAQPLRHGLKNGAAQWSTAELVRYLQSGRTERSGAFGPMAQVVENSTQYMTPQDLGAVAAYLQSIGAPAGYTPPAAEPAKEARDASVAAAAPNAQGVPNAPNAQAPVHPDHAKLRDGTVEGQRGAMIYLNNCNACHRSSGTGWERTFPALAGNSVVNASDPSSLIRIVLGGASMPATATAPTPLAMPAFGWRLNDGDVAELLTFVRGSWGNQAAAVTSAQVAKVRKTLPEPGK